MDSAAIRRSHRTVFWIGAGLALPVLLAPLVILAGERWPIPLYLPGWLVIPPASSQPVTFNNARMTTPGGFTWTARTVRIPAASVRAGTAVLVNKRAFRIGKLVLIQR